MDDVAANHGEVRAACSSSMAWDLGFQDVDHRPSDADHGPSWFRPWIFMVQTMEFHGADHGFSWCRPWIFMVSTMDLHGVDHGFSWCRPWNFMVSTMDFQDVDHGFSWCRPRIFRMYAIDLQLPAFRPLSSHSFIGICCTWALQLLGRIRVFRIFAGWWMVRDPFEGKRRIAINRPTCACMARRA